MEVHNNNLRNLPLFWIYHDFWNYTKTTQIDSLHSRTVTGEHKGHCHFFMPGFDVQNSPVQQAYQGQQTYDFSLNETWSPRSTDINQQFNLSVVGTPKWYFYIEEFWRRIYIQQWDYFDNSTTSRTHLGMRGIKWDASKSFHTRGPFREHRGNYFYDTNLARTLPIEYWLDLEKRKRQHFLRTGKTWDFDLDYPKSLKTPALGDEWTDCFSDYDQFTIPRGAIATGDYPFISDADAITNKHLSFSDEDMARNGGLPDRHYLFPTIEYVCSKQLNWERLPGWQDRDGNEPEITSSNFGDGWSVKIKIPYTVDGIIQSPFSNDNKIVFPPGNYFHEQQSSQNTSGIVASRNKFERLKNKNVSWDKSTPDNEILTQYNPTEEQKGNDVSWNVPMGINQDGIWVEQCLGAFIQAKVKVITEDSFGGRTVNWINTSTIEFLDPFEGKDNLSGQ